MRKVIWLYVRYLSIPFTAMLVGGIGVAMATAYFAITQLESAFPFLAWSAVVGCIGLFSCEFLAYFVRCGHCSKRALVFESKGFDIGNTVAIYDSGICHHCRRRIDA